MLSGTIKNFIKKLKGYFRSSVETPFAPAANARSVEEFRGDLLVLSSPQMLRKYLYTGGSHVLNDQKLYELKQEISDHFSVHFNDVIMVGSGKLGFSIKPDNEYRLFGDESDIDMAVVSTELFNRVWKEIYLYKKSGAHWNAADECFRYLSLGWIRPDKLPTSKYFDFSGEWWDFFREMTESRRYGAYKIRGALYHSMFFFEEYQKICIDNCKRGHG